MLQKEKQRKQSTSSLPSEQGAITAQGKPKRVSSRVKTPRGRLRGLCREAARGRAGRGPGVSATHAGSVPRLLTASWEGASPLTRGRKGEKQRSKEERRREGGRKERGSLLNMKSRSGTGAHHNPEKAREETPECRRRFAETSSQTSLSSVSDFYFRDSEVHRNKV